MSVRRDMRNAPADLSLKEATKALVGAVGGRDEAAGFTRVPAQKLSDYYLPNTDAFAAVDVVVALEKRAVGSLGWPQVTREMARQTGHVLVPLPSAEACGHALTMTVLELTRELGDVSGKISAGFADDGELDDIEIDNVLHELDEHDAVSARLRMKLNEMRVPASAKRKRGQ